MKLWIGLAIILCAMVVVFIQNRASQEPETIKTARPTQPSRRVESAPPRIKPTNTGRKISHRVKTVPQVGRLANLIDEWKNNVKNFTGPELRRQKHAVVTQAIESLEGPDYGEFLKFLSEQNEDYFLIFASSRADLLVAGEHAEDGIKWYLNNDNPKLQTTMAMTLGKALTVEQVKRVTSQLTSSKAKENVLSGHCAFLASYSSAKKAVERYMQLRPKEVSFAGLAAVVASARPETDFAELSTHIPADTLSVASEVRRALLSRWSGLDPQKAANYITEHPETVAVTQLKPVVARWLQSDSETATNWLENLPEGKHRDVAYLTLSERKLKTNPARAWELSEVITDPKIRDAAIRQVHREWVKYDQQAADAARKNYLEKYPQSQPKQD